MDTVLQFSLLPKLPLVKERKVTVSHLLTTHHTVDTCCHQAADYVKVGKKPLFLHSVT